MPGGLPAFRTWVAPLAAAFIYDYYNSTYKCGAGCPTLTVRTVPLWFKWKAA